MIGILFFHFSWVPVYTDKDQRLAIMSIGLLLHSRNDAVVWRGPKKNGSNTNFLLFDFPNSPSKDRNSIGKACLCPFRLHNEIHASLYRYDKVSYCVSLSLRTFLILSG